MILNDVQAMVSLHHKGAEIIMETMLPEMAMAMGMETTMLRSQSLMIRPS